MTLKDIAKEVGVSTVTVSNVINGNHKKVSADTIKRIEEVITKYNYKPNATARSLAMKKSNIIGFIIPNVDDDENFLMSPYNAEIFGVFESYVRSKGYYLMVRSVKSCIDVISLFATWNVDGLVFLGALQNEIYEIRKKMQLPLVFLDAYFDELEIANVGVDDYKGGYLSAKYLIARGHKNIAFIGPDYRQTGVISERFKGYKTAMQESDLEIVPERIYITNTSYDNGIEVGKKIAFSSESITAIVSMSDILALGCMEGLRLSGKIVPDDVSIIGFDNLPECRYSYPKLTTVSQNISLKAEKIAKYLFMMIENKEEIAINDKVDVEIIERQSVRSLTMR
ncbi:MAG: LacI family transcriptional regulator [Firmicutes bacterium]|nr:LacI family transcriptional regulator [Bacillota bacterium]